MMSLLWLIFFLLVFICGLGIAIMARLNIIEDKVDRYQFEIPSESWLK